MDECSIVVHRNELAVLADPEAALCRRIGVPEGRCPPDIIDAGDPGGESSRIIDVEHLIGVPPHGIEDDRLLHLIQWEVCAPPDPDAHLTRSFLLSSTHFLNTEYLLFYLG